LALFVNNPAVSVFEQDQGPKTLRFVLDEVASEPIGIAINLNLSSEFRAWLRSLSQFSNTLSSLLVEDDQSGRVVDQSVVLIVEQERFFKRRNQCFQDACQPSGFYIKEHQPGNNNYGNQQQPRQQRRVFHNRQQFLKHGSNNNAWLTVWPPKNAELMTLLVCSTKDAELSCSVIRDSNGGTDARKASEESNRVA